MDPAPRRHVVMALVSSFGCEGALYRWNGQCHSQFARSSSPTFHKTISQASRTSHVGFRQAACLHSRAKCLESCVAQPNHGLHAAIEATAGNLLSHGLMADEIHCIVRSCLLHALVFLLLIHKCWGSPQGCYTNEKRKRKAA